MVAPQQAAAKIVAQLNALDGEPVKAMTAATEAEAREWVMTPPDGRGLPPRRAGHRGHPPGRLGRRPLGLPDGHPDRPEDRGVREAPDHGHRHPRPQLRGRPRHDVLLPGPRLGDRRLPDRHDHGHGRGLPPGQPPAHTLIRLGALLLYAVVSGVAGAVIVGPVFDALGGHFWALSAIGTLVVMASAATALALQTLLGLLGTGLVILLFVVLGNPSSGGVYPAPLLPAFWSAIGQALPPGAGTTLVRNTAYFSGHATTAALWVLIAYAVGGAALAWGASWWRERQAAGAGQVPAADAATA